jgi:hypothetical protein
VSAASEGIEANVEGETLDNWSGNDRQGREGIGSGLDTVQYEGWIRQGLDRGNYYRNMLWKTASHDGLNGDLLDSSYTVTWCYSRYFL